MSEVSFVPVPARRLTVAAFERERRLLSGAQLAVLTNVSAPRISLVECGHAQGAAVTRRIARAFGIEDHRALFNTVSVALVVVDDAGNPHREGE